LVNYVDHTASLSVCECGCHRYDYSGKNRGKNSNKIVLKSQKNNILIVPVTELPGRLAIVDVSNGTKVAESTDEQYACINDVALATSFPFEHEVTAHVDTADTACGSMSARHMQSFVLHPKATSPGLYVETTGSTQNWAHDRRSP